MFNKQQWLKFGAFCCVLFFLIGTVRLFRLRFDAGDLYPPYSSLRSDPLGVQVLYESLNNLGRKPVDRNFRSLTQAVIEPRSTFFVCGLSGNHATQKGHRWQLVIDSANTNGGRIVFAFTSTVTHIETENADKEKGDTVDDTVEESPEETSGLWGLGFELHRQTIGGETPPENAVRQNRREAGNLPETLIWRSDLFFELNDPAWETVFSFEEKPVVARRLWGKGEIVIVADSYPFSNEALRNHRSSGFLTWVVGADGPVIFDEFHHGLTRQPGIASLARKYRLHGVVLSLAVLTFLLIWRTSATFLPIPADTINSGRETDPGPDVTKGWVNLMKQHIGAGELFAVCLRAWESSAATEKIPKEKARRVRDTIARHIEHPDRQDPVTVYQSICELLKQGKKS